MYNSTPANKNKWFSQKNPFSTCHCQTAKCRDPRCSFDSYKNWAHKQSAIISYFLRHHLPYPTVLYRGCFKMPAHATIADHKETQSKFLRKLRELKKQGLCFDFRSFQDVQLNATHYDFVGYGSPNLQNKIKSLWYESGGTSVSCVIMPQSKISRISYYITHYNQTKYLPEHNGLDMTFGTFAFFTIKQDALWDACIQEWGIDKSIKDTSIRNWSNYNQKQTTLDDDKNEPNIIKDTDIRNWSNYNQKQTTSPEDKQEESRRYLFDQKLELDWNELSQKCEAMTTKNNPVELPENDITKTIKNRSERTAIAFPKKSVNFSCPMYSSGDLTSRAYSPLNVLAITTAKNIDNYRHNFL